MWEFPHGSGKVAVRFIDPRHVSPGSIWYFVARRELDRLYPAGSAPIDHEEPLQPIDRAKVVLRDLYRTKAEMLRSLKEATNAVDEECGKRGWQAVSSPDTIHRAAEQLGYRAPRKRK
jgi:hypothetical protein